MTASSGPIRNGDSQFIAPVDQSQEKVKITMIPSLARNKTQHLCSRVKDLVAVTETLMKVAGFVKDQGATLVTGAATIYTGAGMMGTGIGFIPGLLVTGTGIIHLLKAFQEDKTDVTELLENARAGVDMIGVLNDANLASYNHMGAHLQTIDENVGALTHKLGRIQEIASVGREEIGRKKDEASALYRESLTLYEQSRSVLREGQDKIAAANHQLKEAIHQLKDLAHLAQEEEGDMVEKLRQFNYMASQIHEQCMAAQKLLDEGEDILLKGLKLSEAAHTKNEKAHFAEGEAIAMAESALRLMQKETEHKAEVADLKKASDAMHEELNAVTDRAQALSEVAQDIKENLDGAEQAIQGMIGTESLIIGGGTGAALGAFLGGPVTSAAGAIAGAKIYHHRKKINGLVFPKKETVPQPPTKEAPLTYKFKEHSTGWVGWWYARPSETVGTIALQLGQDTLYIPYNCNHAPAISISDQVHISKKLQELLDKKQLSKEECLNIITRMETEEVSRGSRGKLKGFISPDSPYFKDLKRQCNR